MAQTMITSEVDFNAQGKQSGYLRLPHSVHRSAYGWIPVPLTVIKNGDGPCLMITGGTHGDEYEGQIAVCKLARELEASDIRGTLILIPMLNAPAARAGLRTSPIDQGNLNRAFPGDPAGTPTQVIAHYVEEVLMPICDYYVDLHSGGSSLMYPPTSMRGQGHTKEETEALLLMQEAIDLPYAWVFTGGGGRGSTGLTTMAAANRKGVVTINAELGGAGAVSRDILAMTERGLRRVLHALQMLPGYTPDATRGSREMNVAGLVYTYDSGLFEPFKDIGDDVAKGEVTGVIHYPDMHGRTPMPVLSPHGGMVLCKRVPGQVQCGDTVFQIAVDAV